MSGETKKYEVKVHDGAVTRLENHVRFLAERNVSAARKLRVALYEAIQALEVMPHRCPVYGTHLTADNYRRLIIGKYQIIFSVNEEEAVVYIKYILDSRQDNDMID
jgi:plasmid stabilization system protein ParE